MRQGAGVLARQGLGLRSRAGEPGWRAWLGMLCPAMPSCGPARQEQGRLSIAALTGAAPWVPAVMIPASLRYAPGLPPLPAAR